MTVKVSPSPTLDSTTDPLAVVLAPPPSETEEERKKRLEQEQEAKRISDGIDEELDKERNSEKPVKILLLGTSLSREVLLRITLLTCRLTTFRPKRIWCVNNCVTNSSNSWLNVYSREIHYAQE